MAEIEIYDTVSPDHRPVKENEFQKDIQEIIDCEGLKDYTISIHKLPVDGGNYLAELYTVDIKGKDETGEKEINLFIKKKISAESTDLFDISDLYKREIFVYSHLFKVFEDLQEEAGVPTAERYNSVNYYNTINQDTVIMDNLVKKGYKMFDRMKCITLEYAEQALQQLAKYHALSFAMEKKRPDYHNDYIKSVKNYTKFNEDFTCFCNNSIRNGLDGMKPELAARAEKVLYKLCDEMSQCFDSLDQVSCLCHGDFRVSNIMMREKNNDSLELIPLDFQGVYFGPPLNDFFYFILGSTDQDFRRKYMDYLKMYYRQQLQEFLKYFDIDLEIVYPKKIFDADYDRIIFAYGLPVAFMVLPFNLSCDEYLDLSKEKFTDVKKSSNPILKNRFRELIEDFIEWGYI